MARGQKTGGRQKGTPNKVTQTVKEALHAAFDEVGGKDYLVRLATTDPKAFCMLIGKVIPTEVNAVIESHHFVIEAPASVGSLSEWASQHAPKAIQ
jgi:hypothetical protein